MKSEQADKCLGRRSERRSNIQYGLSLQAIKLKAFRIEGHGNKVPVDQIYRPTEKRQPGNIVRMFLIGLLVAVYNKAIVLKRGQYRRVIHE